LEREAKNKTRIMMMGTKEVQALEGKVTLEVADYVKKR